MENLNKDVNESLRENKLNDVKIKSKTRKEELLQVLVDNCHTSDYSWEKEQLLVTFDIAARTLKQHDAEVNKKLSDSCRAILKYCDFTAIKKQWEEAGKPEEHIYHSFFSLYIYSIFVEMNIQLDSAR